MRIDTYGIKGNHEWYEDGVIQQPTIERYGVIDGATSLHPYRGKNGETGAYLATAIVKRELEAEVEAAQPLLNAVLQANEQLRVEMLAAGIYVEDAAALWSCALACVQIHEQRVDYVQAGDCMIVAKYKNGNIRLLTYDQVAAIGEQSLYEYKKLREQGHSHLEAVERIKPQLAKNRYRANQVDGYTVLNGQRELANVIEYGSINRNGLAALYIMSDGMFLPEAHYLHKDEQWTATIELMDKLTLSDYASWLIEEELADLQCEKNIRLKVSDDKTALKILF